MPGFASADGIRSNGPGGRHIPLCGGVREDTSKASLATPASQSERKPRTGDGASDGELEYDKSRSSRRPSIVRQISQPVASWEKRVCRDSIGKNDEKHKAKLPGSSIAPDLASLEAEEMVRPRGEARRRSSPTSLSSVRVDNTISSKVLARIRSSGSLRPSSAASTITEPFPEYVDLSPPEPFHNTHFGASQQPGDSQSENRLPGWLAGRVVSEGEELDRQWQDVLDLVGISGVESDKRRQGLE